MLAVESIPSNSYKSTSLQFILLIIIFKWKTPPQLNDTTITDQTTIASIKISLVYSLRHGSAEINSPFFVMAPFFKLLYTKFGFMCCLTRSVHRVQNKAEKMHIMWQMDAFPFVFPGAFGRWSCYLLHWVATGTLGGRIGPQDCSLNICFFTRIKGEKRINRGRGCWRIKLEFSTSLLSEPSISHLWRSYKCNIRSISFHCHRSAHESGTQNVWVEDARSMWYTCYETFTV
jgi:hypothetical protein